MSNRYMAFGVGVLMTSTLSAFGGGSSGSGLLVLNSSADGALTMSGSSSIEIPARLVHVNSSSPTAVETVGQAILDAPSLSVVGGISFKGQSGCTGTVRTGVPGAYDPMYGRSMPDAETMDWYNDVDFSGTEGSLTLEPGVYPDGIRITGNTDVLLSPGVYVIGGSGLVVTSGTVSGEGVCLVIDEGECRLAGASSLHLSAPQSGQMEGVVLVQSRENTTEMRLAGGSEFLVTGTIYVPSAELTLVGNSEIEGEGPRMGDLVIADRVTLHGTSMIKIGDASMSRIQFPSMPLYD